MLQFLQLAVTATSSRRIGGSGGLEVRLPRRRWRRPRCQRRCGRPSRVIVAVVALIHCRRIHPCLLTHSLTHSSVFQHNTPTLPPHPVYLHHIPQSSHSLAHPELNPKTPPNPHTYTKASKASPRIKHRTSQIGATSQTSEQQQR